jgi:hypothetical protein
MAGFAKITTIANSGGQNIVSVFWYRSATWLPFAGNPFDEMADALTAFSEQIMSRWRDVSENQVVMQRLEGVGYTDAMEEVPGSNNTKTIQLPGLHDGGAMDSVALTANITWRLGVQHQITGLGTSKRNRGTTSFGPIASSVVTDDGHFSGTWVSLLLDAYANVLRQNLVDLPGFATLIPIRMHKAMAFSLVTGTTYSDILGYSLPTKVSFRRSRLPEA